MHQTMQNLRQLPSFLFKFLLNLKYRPPGRKSCSFSSKPLIPTTPLIPLHQLQQQRIVYAALQG